MAENQIRYCATLDKQLEPVPPVEGSESRLVQVFVNLLVNAAQAIGDGSPERNTIRIRTYQSTHDTVSVEVTDTGSGIPAHQLARIFDPFFTTKPVGLGTGLGLSICHGLIRSMGGTITAESQVGKGTTFRVSLLSAEPGSQRIPRAPSNRPPEAKARVLIIDDEPMILRSMQRILKDIHDVSCANDAREGLDLIRSGQKYDVILCDLMMPEVTGMDFHTELMASNAKLAARVVFITGGAFTPKAKSYLDSVDNPRLEKPVDPAALRRLVREMASL